MPDLTSPQPNPRRNRRSDSNSTLIPPKMIQQTDQERDAPPDISSEEIARRAFARWEDSDRSHGRDQEHWFAAEEELRRRPRRDRDRPRQGEDIGFDEGE